MAHFAECRIDNNEVIRVIVVSDQEEKKEISDSKKTNLKEEKKVGRNEKCPCGSGKKFKHCHGNI